MLNSIAAGLLCTGIFSFLGSIAMSIHKNDSWSMGYAAISSVALSFSTFLFTQKET